MPDRGATEIDSDADLKLRLREVALREGFFNVRVAGAHLPDPDTQRLQQWLAAGMHGEMDYMQRHPTRDAGRVLDGAHSVLMFAASYYVPDEAAPAAADAAEPTVKIARYACGKDYHVVLKQRLSRIVDWLSSERPGHSWRVCVDSAPLLERAYAALSGIGFPARNTMIIAPGAGSYFFLAEIVTTATIEPDPPIVGTCGTCTRCIDACPTGAITAPHVLDARKCISYLTIEKKSELSDPEQASLSGWAFGCDICQEVCPYNKTPEPAIIAEFQEPMISRVEPAVTLTAPRSNSDFARQFDQSPLLRPGKRRLARNAAIASEQNRD